MLPADRRRAPHVFRARAGRQRRGRNAAHHCRIFRPHEIHLHRLQRPAGAGVGHVVRPDDPPIDVNRKPFARDELPRVIGGYDIAIDDHSYMPTPLVAQCPELKHIVFLGTGPASYMNVGELEARGIKVHIIKGYGDTAVAEHIDRADVWPPRATSRAWTARCAPASGRRMKACNCSARHWA